MKKIIVSKKGFTLTEIIIVVAIIVFLSAAAFVGVGATINHAKATQAELQAHNGENFEAEAWDKVKNINSGAAEFFDDYYYNPDDPEDGEPDATAPEETGEGEPSVPDGPGPGPGGGGGGEEPKPTEPQPSEPTKAPTPVPTKAPTPTPASSGSGVTADHYVSGKDKEVGVVNISGSGDNFTVTLSEGWGNNCTFSVKKQDGKYYVYNWTPGMQWVIGNRGIDVYNNPNGVTLSSSDISELKSHFGLKLG